MKRTRMKAGQISLTGSMQVHDRRSQDLVINAVVAATEVTDPFGDRVVVLRSLRDDPLAGMYARKQIDLAQYKAGRKWQEYMEDTEVGNIRAIDPSKEAVDGGRFPEPLSDRAAFAFRELEYAHATLGMIGESIVRDVLGRRLGIAECGALRGYTSEAEMKFVGLRFREALNTLAVVFGFATGEKR